MGPRRFLSRRIEHDSLSLEVSDNGRGITPEELRGAHSLGLLGLRERALACGGSITIQGRAGSGTTVALHLPLGTDSPES